MLTFLARRLAATVPVMAIVAVLVFAILVLGACVVVGFVRITLARILVGCCLTVAFLAADTGSQISGAVIEIPGGTDFEVRVSSAG